MLRNRFKNPFAEHLFMVQVSEAFMLKIRDRS